jgi:DNA-binding transcriptional LysR family regulator
MDIRQLKHLVALVDEGTVHAAAKAQFISQPGLSGSIKRLETQLGVPLFKRQGRGMEPTARGLDFYRHAKHILKQLRLAQAELNGVPTSLIVGIGEVRPSGFTAVLYDSLLQHYPQVTVTFVEEHFETLYLQVENGDVDVAFVGATPNSLPASLLGRTLVKSEWRVYCAADHPLSRHPVPVPLAELKQFRWVRNAAAPLASPFVPLFSGREKNPLRDVGYVMAGSQQMAKDLLLHSDLLGFGPRVTWDSELAHGQVVELNLAIKKLYVPIMEVRRRNAYSAVLDQAFAIAEAYYAGRGPA